MYSGKETKQWQVDRLLELQQETGIHPEGIRAILLDNYNQPIIRNIGYDNANEFINYLESMR